MKAVVILGALLLVVSVGLNVAQKREALRLQAEAAAALEPWRAEIKRLKRIVETTEAKEAAIEKAKGDAIVAAARAAAGISALPGFKASADWINAGNRSPAFSLETHCWAIDRHDPAALLSTLHFTPAQRAQLAVAFGRLTPGERVRYGSPEMMLATCWAATSLKFQALKIVGEDVQNQTTMELKAQLQYVSTVDDRVFVFYRETDGWRRDVPNSILESMLRSGGVVP